MAQSPPNSPAPLGPKPPGTAEAAAHTSAPVDSKAPSDPAAAKAAADKAAADKAPGMGEAAPPGTDQHWGLLANYCQKCHNAEDWAGGVAFDTMTPDAISDNAETWEKAMLKLRGRLMPPPGQKQPDNQTVRSFVSWMENNLDHLATTRAEDPGRVALHRLNRKEYANAIWDLLAVKVDANTILPTDDTINGFDNVANVLQVSPSFLDQYLSAARSVAVDAVGEIPNHPVGTQYIVRNAGSQEFYEEGLPLGTRGGMQVTHNFPADGEYELNIGNMAVALWVTNMNYRNHLIATLDGRKFWDGNVGGEEDMKAIDQKQDPAVDAINKRLKGIRFHATAGVHKVGVTFLERTFAESDARLFSIAPEGGQDKVKAIRSFEVRGPFDATGVSMNAARAERQAVTMHALRARAFDRVCRGGRERLRVANRLRGDLVRGAEVLVHERRRNLQGRGDVVEAIVRFVSRQHRRGVDVEVQQILHGVGVFATVQPMQADTADVRMAGGGGVQAGLEIADEASDLLVVGLGLAGRGHQAAAQAADGLLPRLGFSGDVVQGHRVEGDATGPVGRVVALETVLVDDGPVLLLRVGGIGADSAHRRRLGMRRRRGVSRAHAAEWNQEQGCSRGCEQRAASGKIEGHGVLREIAVEADVAAP